MWRTGGSDHKNCPAPFGSGQEKAWSECYLEMTASSLSHCLQLHVVSQARPSHSAAFSSLRINMQREGLAHCLHPFGSMIT